MSEQTPLIRTMRSLIRIAFPVVLWTSAAVGAQQLDDSSVHAGEQVYRERCATCHDHAQEQAPSKELLSSHEHQYIKDALIKGLMRPMAEGLSPRAIDAVATYLVAQRVGGADSPQFIEPSPHANLCSTRPRSFAVDLADWNGFSPDAENSRFQQHPMLRRQDVSRLKPKWVLAYPGRGVYGPPTVVGERAYIGTKLGSVLSLDASTGCTYWSTPPGAAVKTSVVVGQWSAGRFAAYFGDANGVVHAVDAETGKALWSVTPEKHPLAAISGSFTLHEARLYVPFSTIRESGAAIQTKSCCTLRGSVAVLDVATGRTIWHSYTIADEPKPYRINAAGVQMFGPAGASVWSPPTVDLLRNAVYVTTGQSRTDVAENGSDAVIAYDLNRGTRLWSMQATVHDSWTGGCDPQNPAPHCPTVMGPDIDFGSPAILSTLANGKRVLVAAQKSGMVHALNPDANGAVLWRVNLAKDAMTPKEVTLRDRENPGVVFGMAANATTLYAAIADPGRDKGHLPLGIYALDLATGQIVWNKRGDPVPSCPWGARGCTGAQRTAITLIPGVVFAGASNGRLYAYDADNGRVIWTFDTARSFTAVNGVQAQGGAIEGSATVVAQGHLYVMSGYASYGGGAGNALIAFSVDGK